MSQMSNLDKFETISVENCFTQIYNYNLIMICHLIIIIMSTRMQAVNIQSQ